MVLPTYGSDLPVGESTSGTPSRATFGGKSIVDAFSVGARAETEAPGGRRGGFGASVISSSVSNDTQAVHDQYPDEPAASRLRRRRNSEPLIQGSKKRSPWPRHRNFFRGPRRGSPND